MGKALRLGVALLGVLLIVDIISAAALTGAGHGARQARSTPGQPTALDPLPSTTTTTIAPAPVITARRTPSGVRWSGLPLPRDASGISTLVSETPAGLFLAAGRTVVRTDPSSGAVTARATLSAAVDSLAASPSSVWVTVTGATGGDARLLELDPQTLGVRASWAGAGPAVVVAGATVWTAGADLVGRAVSTGTVTHQIPLPAGTIFDDLSTNASGSTLLVATSDGEDHNPLMSISTATGAVTAVRSFEQAAAAVIPAGPIDGTVWIAVDGGHVTFVGRLDLATLAPDPPCTDGMLNDPYCGASQVMVGDGTLWEPADTGAQCVGPVSDRILATVPGPLGDSLVAVGDSDVFVQDPNSGDVTSAPVPTACHAN